MPGARSICGGHRAILAWLECRDASRLGSICILVNGKQRLWYIAAVGFVKSWIANSTKLREKQIGVTNDTGLILPRVTN